MVARGGAALLASGRSTLHLDIIHRFGIANPVPLGQLLNRSRRKYLLCHLVDFAPDLTQSTPRREFTKIRVG